MTTMRALAYTRPSTLEFIDAPLPKTGPGKVLVRPAFTGICGTDLTIWHDRHSRAKPPVILGHEFSGTVIQAPEHSGFAPGDPVVVEPVLSCEKCRECLAGDYNDCATMGLLGVDLDGSMSDCVAVDVNKVIRVPPGLSLRDAAFTEPLAVVTHLFRRAGMPVAGDAVFISGGGPIGLLAGSVAAAAGARVVVSEPNPFRRQAAERLGLTAIDPAGGSAAEEHGAFDGDLSASLAIEASGVSAGLDACLRACRPLGTVVIVGLAKGASTLDSNLVIAKELRLLGTRIYTRVDFEKALELLAEGTIRPGDHISDLVSLESVVEDGFERIDRGEAVLKVLVDHGSDPAGAL